MSRSKRPLFARRKGKVRPARSARRIEAVEIKQETGFQPPKWPDRIRRLKAGRFHVDSREPGGDAPKNFIWVKQPGQVTDNWRSWVGYVAKVGHKVYPSESITEQLLTRVGQIWRLNMADSELMLCADQLRFMSRYFLSDERILNHGAEILAGYLSDKEFVDAVVVEGAEPELFTFQVCCTAIRAQFGDDCHDLTRGFVTMIGFDALVGNQDRHFYNWGVITTPRGDSKPRFAPVYDTARGLFWNTVEAQLSKYDSDSSLNSYVTHSKALIGFDGHDGALRHFDLVERIAELDPKYRRLLESLGETASASVGRCEGMIDAEFSDLLSLSRRDLIKRCLRMRIGKFVRVLARREVC